MSMLVFQPGYHTNVCGMCDRTFAILSSAVSKMSRQLCRVDCLGGIRAAGASRFCSEVLHFVGPKKPHQTEYTIHTHKHTETKTYTRQRHTKQKPRPNSHRLPNSNTMPEYIWKCISSLPTDSDCTDCVSCTMQNGKCDQKYARLRAHDSCVCQDWHKSGTFESAWMSESATLESEFECKRLKCDQ